MENIGWIELGVLKIRLTIGLGFMCILTYFFYLFGLISLDIPESGGGFPGGRYVRR